MRNNSNGRCLVLWLVYGGCALEDQTAICNIVCSCNVNIVGSNSVDVTAVCMVVVRRVARPCGQIFIAAAVADDLVMIDSEVLLRLNRLHAARVRMRGVELLHKLFDCA